MQAPLTEDGEDKRVAVKDPWVTYLVDRLEELNSRKQNRLDACSKLQRELTACSHCSVFGSGMLRESYTVLRCAWRMRLISPTASGCRNASCPKRTMNSDSAPSR